MFTIPFGMFGQSTTLINPLDVSGCILWLDASTLSVSTDLATWSDASGNANDYTQATVSRRPDVVASGGTATGNSVLFVDTSAQFLAGPAGLLGSGLADYTLIIVGYTDDINIINGLFAQYTVSMDGRTQFGFRDDATDLKTWVFNQASGASGIGSRYGSTTLPGNADCIFEWSTSSADMYNYVDGNLQSGFPANPLAGLDATHPTYVGSANGSGGAQYLSGGIREILVYNKEISALERSKLVNYLQGKWQI